MKLLTILAVFVLASSARATTTNTKLLLHGASKEQGQGWGTAGWVILPNLGTPNSPTVVVAGPRFTAEGWWVEGMGGALVVDHEARALLDARAAYDRLAPIHFWSNVQLFPDNGQSYVYVDTNVDVTTSLKLGVESENQFYLDAPDDWSIGPRIVLPLGAMKLIATHQWHSQGGNVTWIRAAVDF